VSTIINIIKLAKKGNFIYNILSVKSQTLGILSYHDYKQPGACGNEEYDVKF
jgi:hypothetical protein